MEVGAEELEAFAKDVSVQPPEVVERVKKLMGSCKGVRLEGTGVSPSG